MIDDVIIRKAGNVGRITLNRPKALHAVTLGICEAVITAILAWEKDGTALVLIDHGEGRGFSAGGDIRWLAEKIKTDPALARRFFFTEYQMNHLLFTSPLAIVAFMDGVVMGGGAGLALPCKYRVATENTRFAMPEAGIGRDWSKGVHGCKRRSQAGRSGRNGLHHCGGSYGLRLTGDAISVGVFRLHDGRILP